MSIQKLDPNSFYYLINVPVARPKDLAELTAIKEKVQKIKDVFRDKHFKLVIGLNSTAKGPITDDNLELSFKELGGTVFFEWTRSDEKINYCEIRNKMMKNATNLKAYEELHKEGEQKVSRIFYVTIDPDTSFTPDVLQTFEQAESAKTVSSLVNTGFYNFNLTEADLVQSLKPQGTPSTQHLNWGDFLALTDCFCSQTIKKELSTYSIKYTKHKYHKPLEIVKRIQNRQKADAISLLEDNYALLNHIIDTRKQGNPRWDPAKWNTHNKILQGFIETLKTSAQLPRQYNTLLDEIDREVQREQWLTPKLNQEKTIYGAEILYPTECVLFATLWQQIPVTPPPKSKRGGQPQHPVLSFAEELLNPLNHLQPFKSGASQEGPKLVNTMRALWRDKLKEKKDEAREKIYNYKKTMQDAGRSFYSSLSFKYTTQMPERFQIPSATLTTLPMTQAELNVCLSDSTKRQALKDKLKVVFSRQPQSLFSEHFLEHTLGRLEHRFSASTKAYIESLLKEGGALHGYINLQRETQLEAAMQLLEKVCFPSGESSS